MTYKSDQTSEGERTATIVLAAFAQATLLAVIELVASSSTADAKDASAPCTKVFDGPVTPSVPVTQGECDALEAFYKANPNYTTAMDQLQYAVKFPFSTGLLEIQRTILAPQLEAPVSGQGTVSEILPKAQEDANKALMR